MSPEPSSTPSPDTASPGDAPQAPALDWPLERVIDLVQTLDRGGCKSVLRKLPGLRLDFTDEYLDAVDLERLRHVVVAAWLQARKAQR